MLRITVILLLACNLLLVGFNVASNPHAGGVNETPIPEVPVGVPTLRLLEEINNPDDGSERQCFSAGPFETLPTMIKARDALGPGALNIEERESQALVELGYWVALPPFAEFADAGAAMRKITRAGIEDVAVVSDREGDFRVSLGYFLEEINARQRRDDARKLGFEAETRLQRENQIRYWLDYQFADSELAQQAADRLNAGQQRAIPCQAG